MLQMLPSRLKSYFNNPWNMIDQAMYFTLLLAVVLRLTLTGSSFVAARYVYAINLVVFYMRILQLYYIHKRLGPKVVVIWRMVCTTMSRFFQCRASCLIAFECNRSQLVPTSNWGDDAVWSCGNSENLYLARSSYLIHCVPKTRQVQLDQNLTDL